MAITYCPNCRRNVEASRKLGVGYLLLFILTAGLWMLVTPLYRKSCHTCGGELTNL